MAVFFRGVMYSTKEYTQEEILLIQFVGRDAYKRFLEFSVKMRKRTWPLNWRLSYPHSEEKLVHHKKKLLRLLVFHDKLIVPTENRTRPIPWSLYLALLFYFDYIPSTHYMIRQLELFPNELREMLV